MRETSKVIVIDDKNYKLTKMTPYVASQIHNRLLMAGSKAATKPETENVEVAEEVVPEGEAAVAFARSAVEFTFICASTVLTPEVFQQIQQQALRAASYEVSPDTFAPVMMDDGRFAAPEIKDDPIVFSQLVKESLWFNICPFFEYASRAAAKKLASSQQS
jgi:hypothetical protein